MHFPDLNAKNNPGRVEMSLIIYLIPCIIVHELLVLDRNTWNHTTICKLFACNCEPKKKNSLQTAQKNVKIWGVWKVTGQMSQTVYFDSKQHRFPFEVPPIESKALPHPFLPCLYALLEELFWDAALLHRFGPLKGHRSFKTDPTWALAKKYF